MRYLFWGTAPKYECENEAPNVFYDSVQIVAVNENIKWRDAIILKPEQIEEHSSFNAVGHTVEVSSQKGYEKTRVRFVLVVNHHRPVLQSPTAEKVDIDVGPEIGELEVIRKSRSFLQSIDIHVDTTFDFDTSISTIEVNINHKLAPKQQYQGGGEMGRYVTVFNPYKRHIPWDRGKMVERKKKKCMGLPSCKDHINCPWVFFRGALVFHGCYKKMENQHVQNVQDGEWIPNRYQWLLFIHMEGSDEAYPHIMVLYDNITQEQNQPPVDMITCFWAQKCASVGVKVTR
jgi:hypothetical protein